MRMHPLFPKPKVLAVAVLNLVLGILAVIGVLDNEDALYLSALGSPVVGYLTPEARVVQYDSHDAPE